MKFAIPLAEASYNPFLVIVKALLYLPKYR
jgi:hypothetical protein